MDKTLFIIFFLILFVAVTSCIHFLRTETMEAQAELTDAINTYAHYKALDGLGIQTDNTTTGILYSLIQEKDRAFQASQIVPAILIVISFISISFLSKIYFQ